MTTHVLTGTVAKQITSDLKEKLLLTRYNKLATDGSSDEYYKIFPVLVRHVDKNSELIITLLLDIPIIDSDSTAQEIYDVCNEVREALSLGRDNSMTYSSDNTNSMIGQLTAYLRKNEVRKVTKRFSTSVAPCHPPHLCTGKRAKALSVNFEDFVIDILSFWQERITKKTAKGVHEPQQYRS